MDEVCRVCGLPTYLSVDRCPYCGEKYRISREIVDCGEKYRTSREIADLYFNNKYNSVIVYHKLAKCCTVNELRKLYGLKDI